MRFLFHCLLLTHSNIGNEICQLNHAGASPSSQTVIDRVVEHMELEEAIGGYAAAQEASRELAQVYSKAASLINAKDNEIALVESATVAWTRAFYAMVEKQMKTKRGNANVIIISEAEYAANVVAASQWARDRNWTLLTIPSSLSPKGESTGMVDLRTLDKILSGNYVYKDHAELSITLNPSRIAMVCITHIPTNSGIVNPIEEIGEKISRYNNERTSWPSILYLVDACQSVGHLCIDVKKIRCHALVATGRKYLRAPRGSGFLYVSSTIVSDLLPQHIDHYGVPILQVPEAYSEIHSVENLIKYSPRDGASRFEFWESNVANRLGLGLAIQESIEIGPKVIEEQCARLSQILKDKLHQISNVVVHHSVSSSCGIVTFYSTSLNSQKLRDEMQRKGFELSLVPATSTPFDSAKTKVPDLVRASVSYTNTPEEIENFVQSLQSLLES